MTMQGLATLSDLARRAAAQGWDEPQIRAGLGEVLKHGMVLGTVLEAISEIGDRQLLDPQSAVLLDWVVGLLLNTTSLGEQASFCHLALAEAWLARGKGGDTQAFAWARWHCDAAKQLIPAADQNYPLLLDTAVEAAAGVAGWAMELLDPMWEVVDDGARAARIAEIVAQHRELRSPEALTALEALARTAHDWEALGREGQRGAAVIAAVVKQLTAMRDVSR